MDRRFTHPLHWLAEVTCCAVWIFQNNSEPKSNEWNTEKKQQNKRIPPNKIQRNWNFQWNLKFVCSDLQNNSTKKSKKAENSMKFALTSCSRMKQTFHLNRPTNRKVLHYFMGFQIEQSERENVFGETLNFASCFFFVCFLLVFLRRWPFYSFDSCS